MPTLHALDNLTVDHVAIQWEDVPPHLVVEFCGVCKFESGHLREASRGALSRWLKGMSDSDIAAKTRCFVLKAQEASGNIQLAEQRMLFDERSGKLVIGLAFPPGMCVSEQNVRMDTVCNFHTLHCSEHLPMFFFLIFVSIHLYSVLSHSLYITLKLGL